MSLDARSIGMRGIGYGALAMAMLGLLEVSVPPVQPPRPSTGRMGGLYFTSPRPVAAPDRARRSRRDDILWLKP